MTGSFTDRLRFALALLAADADEQLAYLGGLGGDNDELALGFDDLAPAGYPLTQLGDLNGEQIASIGAVQRQLTIISSAGGTRWTDDAIVLGEDWAEVRRLARQALRDLGR